MGLRPTALGNCAASPAARGFTATLVQAGSMVMTLIRRAWAWLGRRAALLLLVATASGLAAGGLAHLAGAGTAADAAWLAMAAVGLGDALWSAAESILRGRLGVDVIALLAVAGAVAVGEPLAAAVISVMLTSGRFLEAWAAERARHDLNALLARAPRTARRYRGGSLQTVPLEEIAVGDVLLVAPGDVLPVDGTVGVGGAVLDESALTGEARPAEHGPGEAVRSGTLNAGGPFDLRATTSAADSTYAGIIRLVAEAERSQAPFVRLAETSTLGFCGGLAGVGAWAVIVAHLLPFCLYQVTIGRHGDRPLRRRLAPPSAQLLAMPSKASPADPKARLSPHRARPGQFDLGHGDPGPANDDSASFAVGARHVRRSVEQLRGAGHPRELVRRHGLMREVDFRGRHCYDTAPARDRDQRGRGRGGLGPGRMADRRAHRIAGNRPAVSGAAEHGAAVAVHRRAGARARPGARSENRQPQAGTTPNWGPVS
jgi:hypothetical protein